jgi:hypothetical protein
LEYQHADRKIIITVILGWGERKKGEKGTRREKE